MQLLRQVHVDCLIVERQGDHPSLSHLQAKRTCFDNLPHEDLVAALRKSQAMAKELQQQLRQERAKQPMEAKATLTGVLREVRKPF